MKSNISKLFAITLAAAFSFSATAAPIIESEARTLETMGASHGARIMVIAQGDRVNEDYRHGDRVNEDYRHGDRVNEDFRT